MDVKISEFSESVLLHKEWESLCKKIPADETLESPPCRFTVLHLKYSLFQLTRLILCIHIVCEQSKREVWHIVRLDEQPCVKCRTWSEHEKDISESQSGAKCCSRPWIHFSYVNKHRKLSSISVGYNLFGYKNRWNILRLCIFWGEAGCWYF